MAQSLPQTQSGPAQAIFQEWLSLDARFNEAMTQYDAHQKRSRKASGPALTPFGLIAPESIRIIDEPRDPTLPTTSLLKIILACLMGGIGLGVSLAAIAEQLDDRVYEGRELEGIAGAENVFRIPHIEGDRNLADDLRDRPLRRLSDRLARQACEPRPGRALRLPLARPVFQRRPGRALQSARRRSE